MRKILILLGFLLFASSAQAADGASCDSDVNKVSRGPWVDLYCINVCDDADSTDSSCTEVDLQNAGRPDVLRFEREDVGADCTDPGGPVITITTGPTTGGSPSYALDTTTVVLNDTVEAVNVIMMDMPSSRYLFFTLSSMTACTDVDVRMTAMKRRAE